MIAAALARAAELVDTIGDQRFTSPLIEGDLLHLATDEDAYDAVVNQQVMEFFTDEAASRTALADRARTTTPVDHVIIRRGVP